VSATPFPIRRKKMNLLDPHRQHQAASDNIRPHQNARDETSRRKLIISPEPSSVLHLHKSLNIF